MMLPKLNIVRDHDTGNLRHYITPNGKFPSVTSILSATKDMSGLDRWVKRVGKVEADRIRTSSAARGTAFHSVVENFLINGEYGEGPWWDSVEEFTMDISDVHLIEGPLWHPVGFAGTADAIIEWKGKPCLLDWKTSNSPKKTEWVEDYLLQVTAYAGAANYHYKEAGIKIKDALVVIALEDRPAQIFHVNHQGLKKNWAKFKKRIDSYHRVMTEFTDNLFTTETEQNISTSI